MPCPTSISPPSACSSPPLSYFSYLLVATILCLVPAATPWCELSNTQALTTPISCIDYSFSRTYLALTSTNSVYILNGSTRQLIKKITIANAQCARFSKLAATNKLAITSPSLVTLVDLATLANASPTMTTFPTTHGATMTYL